MKGIDSFTPRAAAGASWIKVKPVHTFDLVVLAVERVGRRSGMLSNIHLGALDPRGVRGARGVRDGGQDLQGDDRRDPRVADRVLPDDRDGRDDYTVRVRPITVVEIAIDGVQRSRGTPAGSPCGSRASRRIAMTSGPRMRTPSRPSEGCSTHELYRGSSRSVSRGRSVPPRSPGSRRRSSRRASTHCG